MTIAWTLTNIGKDIESKVTEHTVAANAEPASAPHSRRRSGVVLYRRAVIATIAGPTRKTRSARTPTDPSSTTELKYWLSKMFSESAGM
jgi:hypothetical protein